MTGDFFVLSGRIGQDNYLAPEDIKTLVGMGMGIGLHGQDHVDWRRLDQRELHAETVTARTRVAQITGGPITKVSVPFGAYDQSVLSHLGSLGYSEIHTSDGGKAKRGARLLAANVDPLGHER